MSNLAIDIKNRREELGLTVKEMADSIGLPKDGDRVLDYGKTVMADRIR